MERKDVINQILNNLKILWEKYPILRFQQLIELIKLQAHLPDNIFYVPDKDLLDKLQQLTHE